MSDALISTLSQILNTGLPGREYQRVASPELSYGRHFGPPPANANPAAVIVVIQPQENRWTIPLTKRPATLKNHGGQVCLPGGVRDKDESLRECAIRELDEELGVSIEPACVVGQLSPIYVFASNFAVTPFVAVQTESLNLRPNPDEVEEVIDLPLDALLDEEHVGEHEIERRGLRFRTPHLQWEGHRIWGATHVILSELAEIWRRIRRSGRAV